MKDSLQTYKRELMSLSIMEKLDKNINSAPNTNYEIPIAKLVNGREKHIPCKLVKYNKYKHKNLHG